jgi:hypothetical protein
VACPGVCSIAQHTTCCNTLSSSASDTLRALLAAAAAAAAVPAGCFKTAEEAALLYDATARILKGPAAVCNLPLPSEEEQRR